MSTVGIKELKNRLTEYLRRTKRGDEIIVTERGKPIAVIQSISTADRLHSVEAKLAKMAAQGLVSLASKKLRKKVRLVQVSGKAVSEIIISERR